MAIIPNQSTDLMWFLAKYLGHVLQNEKSHIAKAILRKKNKAGSITFPDFRLYYKSTIIKTVQYWHTHKKKDRSMEQDREHIDKSMHLWSSNLCQRRQEYTMEEKSLQEMLLGKLDNYI